MSALLLILSNACRKTLYDDIQLAFGLYLETKFKKSTHFEKYIHDIILI